MAALSVVAEADRTYAVPNESVFGEDDFIAAADLQRIAQDLIARHVGAIGHLASFEVVYLWKKTGGKSKGSPTLGKCQKPSGLLAHFTDATYVIWLAADHCRDSAFTGRQIEALLYHELLHTAVHPDTMEPILVGHDVEEFRAVIESYGLWDDSLRNVAPAFRQLGLEV